MRASFTESCMVEKLHYKSLRPGARHRAKKLWLVSITKPRKVTGSWVSGESQIAPGGGEGWDMIVEDLWVKFPTYVTARDRDRRGRQLRHWLLATWRARSGGDDVRKVVHLPPLRLYSAWLGGRHAAAAPVLNTNGMLDTSKWLWEVLIPLKWGLNQHAWQVPESRKGIQHGGRQLNTRETKLGFDGVQLGRGD